MKTINNFILEKLNKINSKNSEKKYTCQPKILNELRDILKERLKENKDADLNDIDVSQIIDMSGLFEDLDPHNIDISEWDVSKVTNMMFMFDGCINFNSDLSNWDVSKITNMSYMFENCKKFDCDLSSWNVSNVKNMWEIFYGCNSLKNKPKWYKE